MLVFKNKFKNQFDALSKFTLSNKKKKRFQSMIKNLLTFNKIDK